MAPHPLTGFEPFGGDAVNPSQELAKAVDGRTIGALVVRSLVLPVQHEAARDIVAPELDADGLAAVVHLGLAGGRARVSLERVAVNVMDYQQPDAAGDVKRDEACVPGGPPAYWSTLPLRAILAELAAEGIPAHLSYTAGAYLCNFAMYTTLHALAERGRTIPPGSSTCRTCHRWSRRTARKSRAWTSTVTTRALEVILRTIARPEP